MKHAGRRMKGNQEESDQKVKKKGINKMTEEKS